MFKTPISELENKAYAIRRDLIDLIYKSGSGHLDTSLSLVEIWLGLVYSDFFNFNPKDGAWVGRDRIFLSEGHACPLQYTINAELGYYPKRELFSGFRLPDSPFQGHTTRNLKYGFENSNGSLSIGLWQAFGHALEIKQQVFCIAGDGEFQEASSMSLLTAPFFVKQVPNFTLIINLNGLAQDSTIDLGPIDQVAKAYNWHVIEVNGHNFEELGNAYQVAVRDKERSKVIIARTVKGEGANPEWAGKLGHHGKPPANEEEYQSCIAGLEGTRRV